MAPSSDTGAPQKQMPCYTSVFMFGGIQNALIGGPLGQDRTGGPKGKCAY